jgi:PucR C-terminal helix-turn-helix domain/GGDEF-like domain
MERSAVEAATSEVAAAVVSKLAEVSRDVWQQLIQDIPELHGDDLIVNLLAASVEENIATVLHMIEYGMVPQSVDAPAAAVEYARRLAQRGMSMIALVRAYRLGHARFLQWCLDELGRQTGMTEPAIAVTHQLLETSFGYVDRTSEQVVLAYQQERDNWMITQTTVRAGRVKALLSGAELDVDATEVALGYRLRQTHLCIVAWVTQPLPGGKGLSQLNRLIETIAAELDCPSRPLVVPSDESVSWAWLPLGSEGNPSWEDLKGAVRADGTARLAVGEPAAGVAGFRSTHREARRAQDVALAARPGVAVTAFHDVGPIALLCADLDATRDWVAQTLGGLIRDDEPHGRLRETLLVFLASGGSYTSTAETLILHKNTVQYRVRKAEEAAGRPISDHRSDVELALRTCKYLGKAVLIEPG